MRKMYWSTEEVPAEEFWRRLRAWLCEPSHLSAKIRFDSKVGLLRCTFTHLVTPDDGQGGCELIRTFTAVAREVENAVRQIPREDIGLPEVESGDGPEGDHHESCDCHACTQVKLF